MPVSPARAGSLPASCGKSAEGHRNAQLVASRARGLVAARETVHHSTVAPAPSHEHRFALTPRGIASVSTSRQTPLHELHEAAGAQMAEVDGWLLPARYGALAEEYAAVRTGAGVFDRSHLGAIELRGEGVGAWLRTLLANDVARLDDGEALLSCLCDEAGGVLDELIVCRLDEDRWLAIGSPLPPAPEPLPEPIVPGTSAGALFEASRPDSVTLSPRPESALLAVQGPAALEHATAALAHVLERAPALVRLERFDLLEAEDLVVLRSGRTGEDGVEILLPAEKVAHLWTALLGAGAVPCGQEVHEVLRIEAGICRFGRELDALRTPVESGLGATVDLADPERAFVGRETLEDQLEFGGCGALVGLVYDGAGRREMRAGQSVQLAGRDVGTISSATFSPTLERSVALALVERPFRGNCDVVIDAHPFPASTAVLPFVRGGGEMDD